MIINPNSGKGKAKNLFNQIVQPILEQYNVKYQVFLTEHANHALEFIENHNDLINTYSAISVISGDGLLYEVLNGFIRQVEQLKTNKIPIPLSEFSLSFHNSIIVVFFISLRHYTRRFRKWPCYYN